MNKFNYVMLFFLMGSMSLNAMEDVRQTQKQVRSGITGFVWSTLLRPLLQTPQAIFNRFIFNPWLRTAQKNEQKVKTEQKPESYVIEEKGDQIKQNVVSLDLEGVNSEPILSQKFDGLQQLSVVDQSDDKHANTSGGASCGYHALKNAIFIASNQFDLIADDGVVNDLFAKLNHDFTAGSWRREIVNKRLRVMLTEYVRKQLIKHFLIQEPVDHPYQENIEQILTEIIGNIAQNAVTQIMESSGKPVTITVNDIRQRIGQLTISNPQSDDPHTQQSNYVRSMFKNDKNDSVLGLFVRVHAQEKTFSEKEAEYALDCYNNDARQKGLNSITLSGDWLDDGELDYLIKHEKKSGGLLEDNNIGISVIEDMSSIEHPVMLQLLGFGEIKNKLSNPNYKHAFLIGTMEHDKTEKSIGKGASGHWFTLVVTSKGAFVTNSKHNINRLFDEKVQKIIKKLGKEQWLSNSQGASTLAKQKIEQNLLLLEKYIKEDNEHEAMKIQYALMQQQEEYKKLGGKHDFQSRIKQLRALGLTLGLEREIELEERRKQLHGDILGLFDKERDIEKLQEKLIPKQSACEYLGLSFKPYAEKLTKRLQLPSTN